MSIAEKLKVNEPNVVHETIDGETILLDLNSGNYFSLDGTGAKIWEFITKKSTWRNVIEILSSENPNIKNTIESSLSAFVQELINENLLVESADDIPPADTSELETQLKATAKDFVAPKVNKYSDMQDLLLLDPIHEVDEKGWPESKELPHDEQNNGVI